MIDIRQEFNKLLEEYAIDCLYVHNNNNMKCSCYNELHKSGDPKHTICGGTGFVNIIEKIKTINHGLGTNFEIGDFRANSIGNVYSNFEVFYVKHNAGAKVRDMILLTGFNEKSIPKNIIKVYEVTAVDEIRGDSGRIEINMLLTKARPDLIDIYQKIINNFKKSVNIKGRLFLWQKT